MQENDFFSSFKKVYEKLCKDMIIGSHVTAIPLEFLNIGTRKAKELTKEIQRYEKLYEQQIVSPMAQTISNNASFLINH